MTEQIPPHPAAATVVNFTEWATDSTKCFNISLVEPQRGDVDSSKPLTGPRFNPVFTYSIFGDHETIFGYKDLTIKLDIASGSLRSFLTMDFSSNYLPGSSSTVPESVNCDNVLEILKDCLPEDVLTNYDRFVDVVKNDYTSFKPIGEKIEEYSQEKNDGNIEHFEIYKSSFSNSQFKEYHSRMQFFVLLFIEGASYIDSDDEKWEIYTIFKREKVNESNAYHFVGYSTVYPFYGWPDCKRVRISQFIVLPPYKKKGHGSKLYTTLYQMYNSRSDVIEVTVEDPNDEFSDMRDKNDIRYLVEAGAFQGLKAPVSQQKIEQLCTTYKLTNRQTQRCLEIYLLSNLNKLNPEDYKAYRLQVKKRLYILNFDVLRDMDDAERLQKLTETYLSVEDEYHRILEMI